MSNTKYNIAKRAREWAYQAHEKQRGLLFTVPYVFKEGTEANEKWKVRVGKAVERLMREAYNEGFNAGYESKKGKDECSCCAHTNETENSERK